MRCGPVRALSSEYLAGELDDRQRSAIRGHLRSCEACRNAYDDEQRVVEAAAAQGVLDPPASLWDGIVGRLAEQELADSQRSRAWFWWRGLWHRYRPHFVGAALAAATAVGLLLWPGDAPTRRSPPALALSAEATGGEPTLRFEDAIGHEVARADARYTGSVEELMLLIEPERGRWSAKERDEFERRLQAFEKQVNHHRQDGLASGEILERDALYAVYRDHIDYLSEVAMIGGLP